MGAYQSKRSKGCWKPAASLTCCRDPGSGTMNTRSHITQFVKFANPYVSLSGKAISVTVGVSHAHPASCKPHHRKRVLRGMR